MFKKILTVFSTNPSRKSLIAEILSESSNRESFLGIGAPISRTGKQIESDIDKAIRYTNSDEYSIWAKEVWAKVIGCFDDLMKADASPSEIDFNRGQMKAMCDLLRISYSVRAAKEEAVAKSSQNVTR